MDNNQYNSNDDWPPEALNVGATSDLLKEVKQGDQEVKAVFDLLLTPGFKEQKEVGTNKLTSNKNFLKKTKHILNKIASAKLINLSFWGTMFFFLLAVVSWKIIQVPLIARAVFLMNLLIALCFNLFFLYYSFKPYVKSPQKSAEWDLKKTGEKAEKSNWYLVKEVSRRAKYSKYILEFCEKEIHREIEVRQDREKQDVNFAQILIASTIILLILYFLPQQLIIKFFNNIKAWPSLIAVLASFGAFCRLMFDFGKEIYSEVRINKFKECIHILQQAQLIVDTLKENNQVEQAAQGHKKPSLMSSLQKIRIDGPEDFAANHDMYISGEKRIEPDLR